MNNLKDKHFDDCLKLLAETHDKATKASSGFFIMRSDLREALQDMGKVFHRFEELLEDTHDEVSMFLNGICGNQPTGELKQCCKLLKKCRYYCLKVGKSTVDTCKTP